MKRKFLDKVYARMLYDAVTGTAFSVKVRLQ